MHGSRGKCTSGLRGTHVLGVLDSIVHGAGVLERSLVWLLEFVALGNERGIGKRGVNSPSEAHWLCHLVIFYTLMELGHCKRRNFVGINILSLCQEHLLALFLQRLFFPLLKVLRLLFPWKSHSILLTYICINIAIILRVLCYKMSLLYLLGLLHQTHLRLCKT